MLTVVMLLFLPAVLAMSIWRAYALPHGLVTRRLRFNPKHPVAARTAVALVYVALFVNTLAVVHAAVSIVWRSISSFDALIARLLPAAVYPLVYLAFEWVLYYAVKSSPAA